MISESLTGVYSKGDRVLCFYMHIVNDTYHIRTDEPTPPALCISWHSGAKTESYGMQTAAD